MILLKQKKSLNVLPIVYYSVPTKHATLEKQKMESRFLSTYN